METNADRTLAIGGSLLLHLVVVGFLYLATIWQPPLQVEPNQGPPIQATLVSLPQPSHASIQRSEPVPKPPEPESAPPPQPKPEPAPQDAKVPPQLTPQAPVARPDRVDQEEIRKAGELAAEQQRKEEQDAKRRQAQIDLSRQKEQEEIENRQRLAKQQEIRKELEKAQHDIAMREQRLQQIKDHQAQLARNDPAPAQPERTPPPGGEQADNPGLEARYKNAIKQMVILHWQTAKAKGAEGVHCKLSYKAIPGGKIFQVTFGDCPFDADGKASVEEALEADLLPYHGFESVFKREGTMDVCYPPEDARCTR